MTEYFLDGLPAGYPLSVIGMFQALADQARLNARPEPVIETDLHSAMLIRGMLQTSFGNHAVMWGLTGCIAMYDGVKVVARRPDLCKQEVDGFREHFGFHARGVQVITENDRAAAGLPPRDHNGMTLDELVILEERLLQAQLEGPPAMFLTTEVDGTPGARVIRDDPALSAALIKERDDWRKEAQRLAGMLARAADSGDFAEIRAQVKASRGG